jgi:hypothetical protein
LFYPAGQKPAFVFNELPASDRLVYAGFDFASNAKNI